MEITSEPASDQDFTFVRDVHHTSYREWTVEQFGPWDEPLQDRYLLDSWNRLEYQIIFADNLPCGYIAISKEGDAVHVREFAIHKDYQGKGVGSHILHQVKRTAENLNLPVKLNAFIKNGKAIRFYTHIGLKQIGQANNQIQFEWR